MSKFHGAITSSFERSDFLRNNARMSSVAKPPNPVSCYSKSRRQKLAKRTEVSVSSAKISIKILLPFPLYNTHKFKTRTYKPRRIFWKKNIWKAQFPGILFSVLFLHFRPMLLASAYIPAELFLVILFKFYLMSSSFVITTFQTSSGVFQYG